MQVLFTSYAMRFINVARSGILFVCLVTETSRSNRWLGLHYHIIHMNLASYLGLAYTEDWSFFFLLLIDER